jgi:hypothetical protein
MLFSECQRADREDIETIIAYRRVGGTAHAGGLIARNAR